MTRAEMMATLEAYKVNLAECGVLSAEISRLDAMRRDAKNDLVETLAGVGAQVITDMPHGSGGTKSPTEEAGIKLADGYTTEDIREIERKTKVLFGRLEKRRVAVELAESLLSVLSDIERWLVMEQIVDKVSWYDVISDYARVYGKELSKSTLKRIRNRAVEKMFDVAKVLD